MIVQRYGEEEETPTKRKSKVQTVALTDEKRRGRRWRRGDGELPKRTRRYIYIYTSALQKQ